MEGTTFRRLFAHDEQSRTRGLRVIAEADAAFPELAVRDSEDLLPLHPRTARCRICGAVKRLSKEHIPPRRAFNGRTSRIHTPDEWLARDHSGAMTGGTLQQGGIWGYTLCAACNNLTGSRYADEYRRWAISVVRMIRESGIGMRELEGSEVQPRGRLTMQGTRPGAFVREALAMMCSTSGGFDIAGRWPEVRRIILNGTLEPLPAGVTVGLTLYFGGYPRTVGPQVVGDASTGLWNVVMEVAVPPLATLMVLGGTRPYPHVFDLSAFTTLDSRSVQDIDTDVVAGFGYTMYPGDYRTREMVETERST